MKIYLLRHTQTVANRDGYIYGKLDYPLTPLGEEQLEKSVQLCSEIYNVKLLTSPLARAKKLAQAVGQVQGLNLIEDSALEEMGFGILEGLTVEESEKRFPEAVEGFMSGDPTYRIPEGESGEEFARRVIDAIDGYMLEGEDVLLVSHGGVIRIAIEYLLGTEKGFAWKLEVGNGCLMEIECSNGYNTLKTLVNP